MDWKIILVLAVVTAIQFLLPRFFLPKIRSYFENRQGTPRKITMTGKQLVLFLLIWPIGASGFFYYYRYCDEQTILLECKKETMTCDYSRTTRGNNQLHFVESHDMKDVASVSVNCHNQKGSGSSCQLSLFKKGSKWSTRSFPFTLDRGTAKQLEASLNLFLTTDQAEYRFYKTK